MMILPTKRIAPDRALLTIGGRILQLLDEPKSISRLWDEVSKASNGYSSKSVPFDWFVLALDVLYALNTVELEDGLLRKIRQ